MNSKQRKALEAVFALPPNGNLPWAPIESLLRALDCRVVEGADSSVTFAHQDCRATFHRPQRGKEALRYRVQAAREFIARIAMPP